jgi:hypothetical protein
MPVVDQIPVAHTPQGGWQGEMPPPVLAGCTEPLRAGAPDLRGLWQVVAVEVNGAPAAAAHKAYGMLQRIEQAEDRMVVTGGGVIHDMRCDGTAENGVMTSRSETSRPGSPSWPHMRTGCTCCGPLASPWK